MKQEKLLPFLVNRGMQIPFAMFSLRKKWKLDWKDFIMLMYLKDKGSSFLLNPKEIERDLAFSQKEVMTSIGVLQDANLLRVEVNKNDKGILEDVVSLLDFEHRYMEYIMDCVEQKDISNSNIFALMEREFGRTLSPMEMEIIKAWLEDGFKEEVIEEAIKEAIFNGVSNLRYIDKILYEWNKKGIRSREDIEKRKLYRKKEEKPTMEVFEYNWFEDDEIDE